MQNEILNTGVSDRVAVVLAMLGLVAAAIATFYGRRAIFPPQRRLTIYTTKPLSSNVAGVSTTRTTITLANTGRYAIDSGHFDRDRPLVVEFGVVVRAIAIKTNLRAREDPQIAAKSTTIVLQPDLINPGEYVTLEVDTDEPPQLGGIARRTSHSLIDTIVDSRSGAPASPFIVKVVMVALVTLVLAPLMAAVIVEPEAVYKYLHARESASMEPDHGPPGTCVVLRGQGFGDEVKVNLNAFITPFKGGDPLYLPVGECPGLSIDGTGLPRSSITSTYNGSFLIRFAIPKQARGMLEIFLDGRGEGVIVEFWID